MNPAVEDGTKLSGLQRIVETDADVDLAGESSADADVDVASSDDQESGAAE